MLAAARRVSTDVGIELVLVSGLDVDGTRSGKPANQAFARLETAHGAAPGLLDLVVTAPRDEVAVVDNVLFARLQLQESVIAHGNDLRHSPRYDPRHRSLSAT